MVYSIHSIWLPIQQQQRHRAAANESLYRLCLSLSNIYSHYPTRPVGYYLLTSCPDCFTLRRLSVSTSARSAFVGKRRVITGETGAAWRGAARRRHPELLGHRSIRLRRGKAKSTQQKRRKTTTTTSVKQEDRRELYYYYYTHQYNN